MQVARVMQVARIHAGQHVASSMWKEQRFKLWNMLVYSGTVTHFTQFPPP